MANSNPLKLAGYPSFCKALGIATSEIDSAVTGEFQSSKKIEFNNGAILEIFNHLRREVKPLYSVVCAFSKDFVEVLPKTVHAKAVRVYEKVKKDRKKNKPSELAAYLSRVFNITPENDTKKVMKENESLKRRLDEQELMMETEIAKLNEGMEEQVEKKIKMATEELTQGHQMEVQDLQGKLKLVKVKKENVTRNLNKQVKRRDQNVDNLKVLVKDIQQERKENEIALRKAQGDVDEFTSKMHELEEKLETMRKAKRAAQNRCSYYRNKGKTEQKHESAKDGMIVNLKQVVSNHVQDLRYYEDLVNTLQSDVIETFADGKYINEFRELIMILLTTGSVSMSKINFVMSQIAKKVAGKDLSRLPSKSVLHRLLMEANTIADVQVVEAMLENADPEQDAGNLLHSDGASKYHRHYEGFQITTPSGQTMTLATVETSGGSAEELIKTFTETISMLAKSSDREEPEEDLVAKLITSIKHTMSDQGSVNPCFNAALKTLRDSLLEKVIPNWDEVPSERKEQVRGMTNYFCKMHIVVNFASEADKVLQVFEGKVTEGVNPYAFANNGESGSVRLIRVACKSFTPRGCDQAGIQDMWQAQLDEEQKKNEMVTYKGNRFNITFYNGAAVYYHKDDIQDFLVSYPELNNMLRSVAFDIQEPAYLAGIRALGIVNKVITGPYWRLLESDGGILTLNNHLLQMKITMEAWSKDASDLLKPEAFLFAEDVAPIHKDHMYEKLLEPATPEIDALTQLALEVMMTSLQIILERQAKDNLPGGKFWNPTERQKAASSHVPKTNTISERDFAMLDHIIANKPAAGVHVAEVIIKWTNNGTVEWLEGKSKDEKDKIFDRARKLHPEMKKLLQDRRRTLRAKKQEKLKERQAKKATIEEKRRDNRVHITNKLTAIGGLWLASEIEKHLELFPTESAKKDALYTQLNFHRSILSAKGPRTLYQKQCKGSCYSVNEMTNNLKKALELNSTDAAPTGDQGLTYVPQDEVTERMRELKLSLSKRLDEERMKRRAKNSTSMLPDYLKKPSALVGRLILHHCFDPTSKESRWYDAEVLEIYKEKDNPLLTEYHVRYGGNPDKDGDEDVDDDDDDTWHFPLLVDLRKGDVIILGV